MIFGANLIHVEATNITNGVKLLIKTTDHFIVNFGNYESTFEILG